MKCICTISTLLLLLFSGLANSDVRPEYSGAWYNSAQPGHGFSIEVISPERSSVFWYVYDTVGEPIFLFADGENVDNQIQAKVYYYEDMIWGIFDPSTINQVDWGTLTITFHDCQNATLEYDSDVQIEGQFFGSGQMPLNRLSSMDRFKCSDFPRSGIYSGYGGIHPAELNEPTFTGWGIVTETGNFNFFGGGMMMSGDLDSIDPSAHPISEDEYGWFGASGSIYFFNQGGTAISDVVRLGGMYDPDQIHWSYGAEATGERGWIALTKLNRQTGTSLALSDFTFWSNWMGIIKANTYLLGNVTFNSDGTFIFANPGNPEQSEKPTCSIQGKIGIPNPEMSLFDVSITFQECDYAAGTFTGHGAFIHGFNLSMQFRPMLQMSVWNGEGQGLVLSFNGG